MDRIEEIVVSRTIVIERVKTLQRSIWNEHRLLFNELQTNQVYTMDIVKNGVVCYEWSIVPCHGSWMDARPPIKRDRSEKRHRANERVPSFWRSWIANETPRATPINLGRSFALRGEDFRGWEVYIYIYRIGVVERPIQLSGLVESGESDFHAKHIEMEAETRSRASTGKGSRLARSKK